MGYDIERERMAQDKNRKIIITLIILGVIFCLILPGIAGGIIAIGTINRKDDSLHAAQDQVQSLQYELNAVRNQLAVSQSDLISLDDEYLQLETNYQALNAQFSTLANELALVKGDKDQTQGELSLTQTTLKDLQIEIEKLQSQNEAYNKQVNRAKAYADFLVSTLSPALQGRKLSRSEMQDLMDDWNNKLKVIDDPTLDEKYASWIDSDFSEKQADDLFLYLIKTLLNSLK